MKTEIESLVTARAVADLQRLVLEAMRAAQLGAVVDRAAAAQRTKEEDYARSEEAPKKAAWFISGIPKVVEGVTRTRLRSPHRYDGFDCQAQLMAFEALRIPGVPGQVVDGDPWQEGQPDPGQIRYCTRLVFDFCQQAGYNPILVREFVRANDWSSQRVCIFRLLIRWNIPAELKLAA